MISEAVPYMPFPSVDAPAQLSRAAANRFERRMAWQFTAPSSTKARLAVVPPPTPEVRSTMIPQWGVGVAAEKLFDGGLEITVSTLLCNSSVESASRTLISILRDASGRTLGEARTAFHLDPMAQAARTQVFSIPALSSNLDSFELVSSLRRRGEIMDEVETQFLLQEALSASIPSFVITTGL